MKFAGRDVERIFDFYLINAESYTFIKDRLWKSIQMSLKAKENLANGRAS